MYIRPKQEFRPGTPATSREKWSRRLQYLYFLRFCLFGWLLLPLMCLLDASTGVSALSRGIMTLTSGWQAFHAMFFVVTLTTTILVCARNIVMNGSFRFASQPPVRLYDWLTDCRPRLLWTTLAVAQIPAIFTLWYVAHTTISEQVGYKGSDAGTAWPFTHPYLMVCGWYAGGLAAAALFWYLVTLFYLWTHEWVEGDGPRALIFPSLLPEVEEAMQSASKPQLAEWLERAMRLPLKFTHIGYAPSSDGPLWELHFLTTVSLIAFVLLYLFLYPVVAPVVTMTKPLAESVFATAICFCVLLGARRTGSRWQMEKAGVFFSVLFLILLGFFVYFLRSDLHDHVVKLARSFPVLASVTVILIFVQWAINGASFFFDRYRVPVLLSAILIIFLPKLALSLTHPAYGSPGMEWVQAHILDWDADHYFEARQINQVTDLPNPTIAVKKTFERLNGIEQDAEDQPLVVVTATGGGIQAAEWTAQVMARLEKDFRKDNQKQRDGYSLHDHLLLASGVSGGSVGLVPYLLEYTAPHGTAFGVSDDLHKNASDDLRKRLTIGPGCSSLEAVAWGLEYYDLQRLALTFRFPILQSAQDAPDDPSTIVAPDRTWALSRAFRRNLSDNGPGCSAPPETMEERDREELTLSKAAENLNNHTMPAFTLNTTVAESGGRFLLSNYMVPSAAIPPSQAKPNTEFLPAESFLQAYANESCANCANGPDGEKFYVDLPLSTAARMSATFPVVSSATRIPPKYAKAASHFLDGGYFDNDGTGSVIEFLYSVMDQRKADPTAKPLRVLLVEIRDGGDLDPNFNPDDLQDQIGRGKPNAPWWTLNQLLGPLDGLWNAGHESVTLRNRRELCVLETAYQGKLFIHHVVFAIPEQPYGKDKLRPSPLSWKLTAGELSYISAVANGDPLAATDKRIKDAMDATDNAVEDGMGWVATAETKTSKELPSDVCSVSNAPSK